MFFFSPYKIPEMRLCLYHYHHDFWRLIVGKFPSNKSVLRYGYEECSSISGCKKESSLHEKVLMCFWGGTWYWKEWAVLPMVIWRQDNSASCKDVLLREKKKRLWVESMLSESWLMIKNVSSTMGLLISLFLAHQHNLLERSNIALHIQSCGGCDEDSSW